MAGTQNPHGHNHGMDSARAKVEQMKKQWAQKCDLTWDGITNSSKQC